jgi:membrane-bound lytic murein transglycosylase D
VHKVKQGETLSGIAERYGTTLEAIAEANDISDPSTIIPGTELKIPTSGSSSGESSPSESSEGDSSGCRLRHRVKKGEWVWQIARKYGVEPQKVMAANNLTSRKAKVLQPGTMLCIP